MRLKKYKKKKVGNYILFLFIIIILSFCVSLFIIYDFSERANNILLPMAESITRKIVTMVINSACDESIISNNLYAINKNNDNEIEMITYNSFLITKLINDVTFNIENKLKEVEEGNLNYYGIEDSSDGGVAEIPFGVIYNSSLLNNIGPKLKLKLKFLGDVTSNIETEVKPYGLNNAYVEMRIKLEVTARIILPFVSDKVIISNVIPISMNIVQGVVPEGYITSYK